MQARVRAPKIKEALWIQGEPFEIDGNQPYALLLDFWTFGCINCLNVIPDLKKLQTLFGDALKIVSIHTPKFPKEADIQTLKTVIKTLEIEHPVIQDTKAILWDAYAIKAWPSWVLIDTQGYIVLHASGEKQFDLFHDKLLTLVAKQNRASKASLDHSVTAIDSMQAILAVASKRTIMLYQHNQLIYHNNDFSHISSVKLTQNILFIADRETGSIWQLDLETFTLAMLINDLRSPWGMEYLRGKLFIALAGSHQLMQVDTDDGSSTILIGNKFEGLRDGCDSSAMLAQPSSLVWDHDRLWFVDAESSSLRYYKDHCIKTLIGEGLFSFGDNDDELLLQHPQSIAVGKIEDGCGAGRVFIADTYNDKIKVYDPIGHSMMTLIEKIYMPISIAKNGCKLYIASMGQHELSVFDIKTMQLQSLELQ